MGVDWKFIRTENMRREAKHRAELYNLGRLPGESPMGVEEMLRLMEEKARLRAKVVK